MILPEGLNEILSFKSCGSIGGGLIACHWLFDSKKFWEIIGDPSGKLHSSFGNWRDFPSKSLPDSCVLSVPVKIISCWIKLSPNYKHCDLILSFTNSEIQNTFKWFGVR